MQIEVDNQEIAIIYNSVSYRLQFYKSTIKKLSETIQKAKDGLLAFGGVDKDQWLVEQNKKLAFYQDFYSRYTAFLAKFKPFFDKV